MSGNIFSVVWRDVLKHDRILLDRVAIFYSESGINFTEPDQIYADGARIIGGWPHFFCMRQDISKSGHFFSVGQILGFQRDILRFSAACSTFSASGEIWSLFSFFSSWLVSLQGRFFER